MIRIEELATLYKAFLTIGSCMSFVFDMKVSNLYCAPRRNYSLAIQTI